MMYTPFQGSPRYVDYVYNKNNEYRNWLYACATFTRMFTYAYILKSYLP
jgi:hypothetical protein